MRHQQKRGLSLVEVVVGIAIVSLMLSALSLGSRRPSSLESNQAAEIVAEELRALRTRAQRQQMPTAMVFPVTGGNFSTGYYTLEGYGPPRVSRGSSFVNELESVYMVGGTWATAASFSPAPTHPELDLATWSPGHASNMMIAFDPTGRVVTNMPTWLGKTSLLFSNNATIGSQTVGGQPFPSLTAAETPVSVTVDPNGLVSVLSGTPDGTSLPRPASAANRGPAQALPPATSASSGATPVAEPIVFYPPRSPGLPTGIDASVAVGQYLRIVATASDADGGPLYIEWTATRDSGLPDTGKFSSSGKTRMVWKNNKWHSTWEWTPPTDIAPLAPENFVLEYRIEDPEGNVITGRLGTSTGKVQARKDGKVIFDTQRFGARAIMEVGTDGTAPKRLTPAGVDCAFPAASPYGDCIMFTRFIQGLFIMNRDGSGAVRVFDNLALPKRITVASNWSPDGSSIVFTSRAPSASPTVTVLEDLYVVKADGTGLRLLASDIPVQSNEFSTLSWGYTGTTYDASDLASQFILYTQNDTNAGVRTTRRFSVAGGPGAELPLNAVLRPGATDIISGQLSRDRDKFVAVERPSWEIVTYDVNMTTGALENPQGTGLTGIAHPSFSFDASRITYSKAEGGGFQIYVADADGSNPQAVSGSTAQDQGASWLVGGGVY